MRLLPAASAMAALGLLSGLSAAQNAVQTTVRAPHRIVTLSPSLTEAVCALGHCAELVGTDRYSTWPSSVAALPKVGGLEDALIERIVTLQPDMVLLGPRSRAGERLQALGVPVQTFDARTHADLKHMLLALGQALGEPARAAELVARMEAELDAAARRVPAAWRGRSVYIEIGAVHAASRASFIGETLARLGLVNVIGSEQGLFPKVSPEAVVLRAPDLVIGPSIHVATLADRPGWARIPAVRHKHLCALDEPRMDLLSRPGPRLGEAAHMVVDCLLALPH
jgi:iron complex transport system substrate-binding protein